jgi:hypothetical protein
MPPGVNQKVVEPCSKCCPDASSYALQSRKKSGASFGSQANALLRKSATYQKRNIGTNVCLLSSPSERGYLPS